MLYALPTEPKSSIFSLTVALIASQPGASSFYRMCYKITDLPFGNTSTVTNQTLYVYADEYVVRDGFRSALKLNPAPRYALADTLIPWTLASAILSR